MNRVPTTEPPGNQGSPTMFTARFVLLVFLTAIASLVTISQLSAVSPDRVDLAKANVRALEFVDDTTLMATLTDGTVRGFDVETRAERFQFVAHSKAAIGLSISSDRRQFATGGVDRIIRIWDLRIRKKLLELTGHTAPVVRVAYLPGNQLISASHDATLRLWDTLSGRELHVFRGHSDKIIDLDVSPDGNLAATASDDKSIRLWGLPQRQLLRTLDRHQERTTCVRFSPDGHLLATGAQDKLLLLWNTADGELSKRNVGHTDMLRAATFSPDGKYLLTGAGGDYTNGKYVQGEDFDIRVWNCDGTMFGQLVGHTGPVEVIRFSPTGNVIATAAWDHSLRFWQVWGSEADTTSENSITPFDEQQQMRQSQQRLAAAYRQARALVDARQGGSEAMNGVLAPSIELLPPIAVVGPDQQLKWQTLNMNAVGARFDAVRFKSPLDVPADLYWAFAGPSSIEWYIVPAEGEMTGFRSWQRLDDLELPNIKIPARHCVRFQKLTGGQISAGQEYALWFSFPHTEPTPISIVLRLLPASSANVPQTADEIAKVLGLRVPLRYDSSRFRVQRFPPKSNTQPKPDRP